MKKQKSILHIYTRVSTQGQENEGTSLESQLQMGQQRARSLGMDFEHHNEKSASSSKEDLENRPVIKEMLARVAEGEIKHIYVYSIDRLSRNTTTATFIRETLRRGQCTLYTNTNETNLESHEQNLLFGIMSEVSQFENMLRTERLKHGKKVRAAQGFWMGGPPPFGYKTGKNKKLVLDKEQSVWVEKIFRWYAEGLSPKDIKHRLDGNVLTNRGNPLWSYGSVEAILRNTHPSGSYVYYEKEISCPRIVDQATWDQVQKRLKTIKRAKGPTQKNHSYPLRDLLVCGHCRSSFHGHSKKYSESKIVCSYRCSLQSKRWKLSSQGGDWSRGQHCTNIASMDCDRTFEGIWETLIHVLKLSHQEREMFKKSVLKTKRQSKELKDKQIEKLKIKIEGTERSIQLLEEKIAEKEVEKLVARQKAKSIAMLIEKLHGALDQQSRLLLEMQNDLSVLENENLWVDWVKDYESNLNRMDELSDDEKVLEIRKYVNRIEVFFNPETRKHSLNLKFRLPIIQDTLEWKSQSKKSTGYLIGKGLEEQMLELDKSVRNVRVR